MGARLVSLLQALVLRPGAAGGHSAPADAAEPGGLPPQGRA